jgi:hypothetical protein
VNLRKARTIAAWILLAVALVGWPVSAFTFARTEPPVVLSLSWAAILIEACSLLTASQVHEEQGDK